MLIGWRCECLVLSSERSLVWNTVRMNPELAQTSPPAYQTVSEPAPADAGSQYAAGRNVPTEPADDTGAVRRE